MVKHIIIWKLKSELSAEEKAKVKTEAKAALEALMGQIEGLLSVKVETEFFPSSNGEMLLDTSFTDEAALKAYQTHPAHVAAANTYVRPYTAERFCVDFEA